MRISHRQRSHRHSKAPRVSISQAEITADLLYPAAAQRPPVRDGSPARARRR
jgi:hypothetical protein